MSAPVQRQSPNRLVQKNNSATLAGTMPNIGRYIGEKTKIGLRQCGIQAFTLRMPAACYCINNRTECRFTLRRYSKYLFRLSDDDRAEQLWAIH